ncbi:MAG TPA: glycosyltransferase [Gemmatimonadaceae bacterium]|nr:glycosyltransferase [Gemmatimonadaceae bacterium]
MPHDARALRIFTWHVHGNYLYYLSHVPHEFYVPVLPGRPAGYGGRAGAFPWPDNVHEVPAEAVRELALDVILFQARQHYLHDQYTVLSAAQRRLPRIYLEHDPPRAHPTDTRHPVDDPDAVLVHVTPFNALMWDSGGTPVRVIEHGVVIPPDVHYTGGLRRGVVVINNLRTRGRRLGADVFTRVRDVVPLDLIGMDADSLGGLGELPPPALPSALAPYRFFFNPIRYTSLGLAVCEAMMIGMPVVGLATTEMATVVENGSSGYVDTNIDHLIGRMHNLLDDPAQAQRLGEGARRRALQRFGIERFVRDWMAVFAQVAGRTHAGPTGTRRSMVVGGVT